MKKLLFLSLGLTLFSTSVTQAMIQQTTDLHKAILDKDYDLVTTLLLSLDQLPAEYKNDYLNARDDNYETALLIAADHNLESIARLLMTAGADLEIPGRHPGQRPLHRAVAFNYEKMVKLLVEHNADIGAEEYLCKRTPLHIAAHQASLAIVIMLIKEALNKNKRNLLFKEDIHKRDLVKFAQEGQEKSLLKEGVRDFLEILYQFKDNEHMLKKYLDVLEAYKKS